MVLYYVAGDDISHRTACSRLQTAVVPGRTPEGRRRQARRPVTAHNIYFKPELV